MSAPKDVRVPDQPIEVAEDGMIRFRANPIVRDLLDFATPRGMGMNEMACRDYPVWAREQFAQLIGYSVSGYSELSYVTDASYERAEAIAADLRPVERCEHPMRISGGKVGPAVDGVFTKCDRCGTILSDRRKGERRKGERRHKPVTRRSLPEGPREKGADARKNCGRRVLSKRRSGKDRRGT